MERDLIPSPESNEATPADQVSEHDDALADAEDEVMRDSEVGNDNEVSEVQLIEIPSDSDEGKSVCISVCVYICLLYSCLDFGTLICHDTLYIRLSSVSILNQYSIYMRIKNKIS